ncbi:MAG: EAL domain-containing protein [Emcibacter sp.]|nr:EAL domain-containing protein [Emcibacter sp.]
MENSAYKESSAPPCQVDELLAAIHDIKRHTEGYRGLHMHFSLLERAYQQPYHRRTIATAFNKLIHSKEGQLFWTSYFDVIFICKDCSLTELDSAFLAARRAIEDSPLFKEYLNADRDDELCDWYDLKEDMPRFMEMATNLKNPPEEDNAATPSLKSMISNLNDKLSDTGNEPESVVSKTPRATTTPLFDPIAIKNTIPPMGPIQLDQLERNLLNMDIFQMMSDQTAYVIAGDAKPQPIFVEHYISVAEIKKKLLPNYNLAADKWLFQRLTRTFDNKLLLALPQRNLIRNQVISININVETVLSREFDKFIIKFKALNDQPLILEMALFDVISDIQKYYDARDKLAKLGCRISLDAIDVQSLAVMDRTLLAVDFLKITWKPDYKKLLGGPEEENIISAITAHGNMRIILCHCDTEAALKFGKAVGIHMYQGFLIDKKFNA